MGKTSKHDQKKKMKTHPSQIKTDKKLKTVL